MRKHAIREYTHKDVEDIKKLLIELQEFERLIDPHRLKGIKVAHQYLEHLLQLCEEGRGKIFVVEIDGGIVGMISVYIEEDKKHFRRSKKFAFISDLIVLPEHQDKGISKELFTKAEQYAKKHNVTFIQGYVLLDHREGLHNYLRNGFHQHEVILRKKVS